ncbi:Ig-like domain repeat protein, partial [Streptomyces kronopolitis]
MNITVQPPSSACSVVLSPPAGTVTAGQPTNLTATVLCNGVAVVGAAVSFTGLGGTVLGTGTTGPTGAATGSVTFATAGPATVTATVTADTTSTCGCSGVSSAPVNVTVQPQQTCTVVLSPPTGTVTVGQPTNLTATVLCNGAAVAGVDVIFSEPGGAVLAQGTTGVTGVATGAVTFATPGAINVTATAISSSGACNCAGIASVPVTVPVQPQQTCSVVLSPPSGTVTVGQATTLRAAVLCNGVPVVGASVNFTGPGGTLATGTTDASGVAAGSIVFATAGATTVTATVASSSGTTCTCTGVSSAPVSVPVQPQQTCTVVLSPPAGAVTAGQPTTLHATVQCNGAVPGALVTFNGPGGVLLGFGITNASGVATVPVTFTTPGATTVTATVTGGGTSTCQCVGVSSAAVSVVVQPQQICSVVLSPPAGTVTVGQSTTLSAKVLCNGVAVPNALVTFNGPGGTALGFG